MEYVTSFIKILSVISVILSALWLIVPKGAIGNHFKYAMGIFVIAVIISVIGSFELKSSDLDLTAQKQISSVEVAENISYESARYIIENLLSSCKIKFTEVRILTDNSDSSGINITKAEIRLVYDSDFPRAAEIIKNQTGIIAVAG